MQGFRAQTRQWPVQPVALAASRLAHLPPGCSFAPRCWLADDECWKTPPELYETDPGRTTACDQRDALIAGAEMPA